MGTTTSLRTFSALACLLAAGMFTLPAQAQPIIDPTVPLGGVGQALGGQMQASGGFPTYTWTFPGKPVWLNTSNGGALSGTPPAAGSYSFQATVTDQQNATSTATLTIVVIQVTTASPLPNGVVGTPYNTPLAVSGGSPGVWTLVSGTLPAGISIAGQSLVGTAPLGAHGDYNFTLRATVQNILGSPQVTADKAFTLRIMPPTLTFTTSSLPNGTVAAAYNQTLTAAGGAPPYSFTALDPLPAGLTLAPNGVLSGTPTAAGPSGNIRFVVTDSFGVPNTAQATLAFTIQPQLQITTTSFIDGVVGSSYNRTLAATGGDGSYTFAALDPLPGGLLLVSPNISGMPTGAVTNQTVNFRVTDGQGTQSTRAINLTIQPALDITNTSPLTQGTVGAVLTRTLTATGGIPPYTFSNLSPLPGGLTLSGADITGTPTTAGTLSTTFQVTDSQSNTSSRELEITINPALQITTSSLSPGSEGTAYNQTLAASGGVPPYSFSNQSPLPPGLNLSTGGAITGTPTAASNLNVAFRVTDSQGTQSDRSLNMNIQGPLTITTLGLTDATRLSPYTRQIVAAGGVPPYAFTTGMSTPMPPGLSIAPDGTITGTPAQEGGFPVDFIVSDTADATFTRRITINVQPPIQITTASLPGGTVGSIYNQSLAASGGVPPYTFTTTGALPPGLSVAGGGAIFGVPTLHGTYNTGFQVTDNLGNVATRSLQMVIAPAALSITTNSLPDGLVSQPYYAALSAGGGVGPYTIIALSGLPGGLSVTNNELTGSPNTAGSFNIQFQVTDSLNATATRTVAITVQPSTLSVTTSSLPDGGVSAVYNAALNASGGLPPYTFSAVSGLPPGLQVSGNTLNGTPTASGPYNLTVKVTDNFGVERTRAIPITIQPLPTITTSSLPDGGVGSAYSQALSGAGGLPGYTFSAVENTLPPGLSVSGNTLVGTPTLHGTFNINFRMTDSAGTQAQRIVSILIHPAGLQITTSSMPNGRVGDPYSPQPLSGIGGVPPFTFSANPATLPSGMTVSGNALTGTPAQHGTFNVEFILTDSFMASTTRSIPVTIIPAALFITTSTLPNAAVNQIYSQPLAAAGGAVPYTFSATGLPPGLAITGNTIYGVPTTPGTYTAQFTVTDSFSVTATRTLTINIPNAPLSFVTSSITDGELGVPFTFALTATGGTLPYTFSADGSTLPPGLGVFDGQTISGTPSVINTWQARLFVRDAAGGTASVTLPITIVRAAVSSSRIRVSPAAINFTVFDDGANPAPQNLNITAVNGDSLPYTVDPVGTAPQWLDLSFQPGVTPAQLRLHADATNLPPGTYQTALRVTSNGQSIEVPVTMLINTPAPKLDVSPRIIQRSSRTVAPREEEFISLRNLGGGAPIAYSARLASNSTWVRDLSFTNNSITADNDGMVRFALDSSGLRPGAYRDELQISTSLGNYTVPVSLFVESSGPVLSVSQRGVRLATRQGDLANARQTIQILNQGAAGTFVNWTATIIRGADIFTLSANRGMATPDSPSNLTIGLKPSATDLPGGRSALLKIEDDRSLGSPDYVVLVADVAPIGSPALIDLSTAGLVFLANAGGAPPTPQTVDLRTGGRSLNYQTTTSTEDGGNWLRTGSATGATSVAGTATLSVGVNQGTLAPGIYHGLVSVGIGTEVRGVGVTLIVLTNQARPASDEASKGQERAAATGSCTATKAALAQTALAEGFALTAGWPATLSARLLDDCGNAVTGGSVIASFSNGDAPIVLEAGPNGAYTGTWQPGTQASSATVRLEGATNRLAPATLEITGGVRASSVGIPVLAQGGFLNNQNPVLGAALAPGTITQVAGENLSAQTDHPSQVPLPTIYKGVEAIIGAFSAPIYSISRNTITVQVPNELAVNRLHTAVLVTENGYSVPVQVGLVPVQPATVSMPNGTLVAQHPDAGYVSPERPAMPGEVITVFLVGMGNTTPAVASGTASPSTPAAIVNTGALVSVGNEPAEVLFQGLAPGTVGLYQVNFRVPQGMKPGSMDLVITQDGITSNTSKLSVGAQ